MKIYNFILSRFGLGFLSFLLCATVANAQIPVIDSPLTASATVGEPFTYVITTAGDDAILYGTSNNLPNGIVRDHATLSGVPTTPGVYSVLLNATNADGTDTVTLELTVFSPVPVITSAATVEGRIGDAFSYTITATNSPSSLSVIGLSAFPNLTLDPISGEISGTPASTANTDILVYAENAAGTASQVVRIVINSAQTAPSTPTVVITSPSSGITLEGSLTQINVSAEVTPISGETLDVVYVRWNNPTDPSLAGIVLTEMTAGATDISGTVTYTATLDIGFNPNDRQLGGGSIDIDVVAFQTNAATDADAGSDNVTFTIKPIMEFLFPTESFAMDSIVIGDVFASVRLSTNNFTSITARIAGSSIVDTISDADASDNQNGVFNFAATKTIDFPGFYDIRITALDSSGNTTILERRILISDSLAEPVAILTAPTPGFTNEVFSAAVLSYAETGRSPVTAPQVGVVGYNVTYAIGLISGGQGYYPRNASDVSILATNETNITIGVPGVTVSNSRVTELPANFTIFYLLGAPEWNASGNAILDDLSDPGRNGWISIAGQFFKANSELESYKLFVNGEDVTPGVGNLDPLMGIVDVPVTFYPGPGRGSPAPGDYLVYAEVTDQQGEVGTSEPLVFTIVPYEPLEISLTRESSGDVAQGTSVTFFAEVTPSLSVESVEFFNSDSGESLGFASHVVIDGQDLYRFTQSFNQQGNYGVYSLATALNGQLVRSDPVRIDVTPVNDLVVNITNPAANIALFKGQSYTFSATASATPGVASVKWIVNNTDEETDTEEPYEFTRIFDTVGVYVVRVSAIDNFGNTGDSLEEITVTVSDTDLSVSITDPVTDQTLVEGESLTFTAVATATVGVDRVEWVVDGEIVETDTAQPYVLTYPFIVPGSSSVTARAYDTIDNASSSNAISVQVNVPNPLLRDEDFVADTYQRLFRRAPTTDERTEALADLNGDIESRSLLVADLLRSDSQETTTIALLIYRTMTGEWPDSSELADAMDVLTNGGNGVTDANALTIALIPEYEDRFAVLNTDVNFVTQLFKNKHYGVSPTPSSLVRLYDTATGASITFGASLVAPGYNGDLISYATQFALDNSLSGYVGAEGLPLTNVHYYSIPNRPVDDAFVVTLITAFWGVEASQADINALRGLSPEDAAVVVLTDPRYTNQFPSSSVEGFVAQVMVSAGVFDLSLISPADDADDDGVSNLMEIALGSDPSDPSDTIEPMGAGVDGTEFVISFIRIKASEVPGDFIISLECSEDLTVWDAAADTAADASAVADQSGVPEGYERVEIRIDMNERDCGFFRLSVDLP